MLSSKIARNFNFIPFSCQRTSAPVAMSQILTVMSPDALTTRLLSGEITTEVTAPACPVSVHACQKESSSLTTYWSESTQSSG